MLILVHQGYTINNLDQLEKSERAINDPRVRVLHPNKTGPATNTLLVTGPRSGGRINTTMLD